MPFESERQRRYMHANHPEIAQRWENEMAKDEYTNPGGPYPGVANFNPGGEDFEVVRTIEPGGPHSNLGPNLLTDAPTDSEIAAMDNMPTYGGKDPSSP